MLSHLTQSGWERVIRIVACCVISGFVVGTFCGTLNPHAQDQDFGAYCRAGQAVTAGVSPYHDTSHGPLGAYMYAPVFAYFPFRWLSMLPYLWAVRVFMLINWVATVACVWLCLRLISLKPGVTSRASSAWMIGSLAVFSAGDYLKANLHNGQVGTLLLLSCLSGVCLILSGYSFVGGLALSVAIALKLYPALIIPYLIMRWNWRALGGTALGLALLLAAPAIFVGFARIVPLHTEWLRFCLSTQISDQTLRTGNQSLLGVLARLPFISDGRQQQFSSENLAAMLKIYPAIVLVISAGLYAFLWYFRAKPTRPIETVVDLALLLLWMTIASPRAWTFNFAAELLAVMLLAKQAVESQTRRRLPIASLAGVMIAILFPTNLLHFSNRWNVLSYFIQNKHFDALVFVAVTLAVTFVIPRKTRMEGHGFFGGESTAGDRIVSKSSLETPTRLPV